MPSTRARRTYGCVLWLTLLLVAVGCNTNPPPPANGGGGGSTSGGPQFVINSPDDGSLVSGPVFFSVQPLTPGDVQSVHFDAGGTTIAPQYPGEDMFKVFLLPRDFADGDLTLTATVTGHDGRRSQRSIAVTVVADPPSQAVVTGAGAILGTVEENGATSVLSIPAGIGEGATVTFEARTQDEVRTATGVDYEALGVTFLGAQEITTDRPLERPLMVSSGGFGPRVQPGQAVVNYLIAPDGDGDGSGELVVVNTASVAPNGDVVSDPIPRAQIAPTSSIVTAGGSRQAVRHAQPSAPPGGRISFPASGFNAANRLSNLVLLHAAGHTFTTFATYRIDDPSDASSGVLSFVVPDMPSGSATLELVNLTTDVGTEPIEVFIEAAAPLTDDPYVVVSAALTVAIEYYTASDSEIETGLADSLTLMKQELESLRASPTPETDAFVESLARLLAGAGSTFDTVAGSSAMRLQGSCMTEQQKEDVFRRADVVGAIGDVLTGRALVGIPIRVPVPPALIVVGIGLQAGSALAKQAANNRPTCPPRPPSEPPPPPGPTDPPPLAPVAPAPPTGVCTPSNPTGLQGPTIGPRSVHRHQTLSVAMTGMGSAPPPGGSGCGSARGGGASVGATHLGDAPGSSRQSRVPEWLAQEPGRYMVKIFVGAAVQPFAGITDATGYFFVPFIPEGQIFDAVAMDVVTGETRTFSGVGPAIGESVLMNFDFWDHDASPGVREVSYGTNTAASLEPDATRFYTFEGVEGDTVRLLLWLSRAVQNSQESVAMTLTSPSGAQNVAAINPANLLFTPEVALSESGTYLIAIGGSIDSPIDYVLGLSRIEAQSPLPFVDGAATLDTALDVIGDVQYVTFEAAAGDVLGLRFSKPAASTLFATIDLMYDDMVIANQGLSSNSESEMPPMVLPYNGTYTVRLMSNYTCCSDVNPLGWLQGEWSMVAMKPQPTPLPPTGSLARSIADGTFDVLTVTGQQGDILDLGVLLTEVTGGGQSNNMHVTVHAPPSSAMSAPVAQSFLGYTPGTYLNAYGSVHVSLPSPGTYTIVANALQGASIAYTVAAPASASPTHVPLTPPTTTVEDRLDELGEVKVLTFDAVAGETLELILAHPDDEDLRAQVRLYPPDTPLADLTASGWLYSGATTPSSPSSSSGAIALASTGRYVVVVTSAGMTRADRPPHVDHHVGDFTVTLTIE